MNIVVLAGGLSPERNVSLVSGSLIAKSLCSSGHKVVLLDVYTGTVIPEEGIAALFADSVEGITTVEAEPDLEAVKRANGGREELIGNNVIEICKYADAVFLALHGAMGENGQLQATLDTFGVKCYSGSGYTGSSLAMNKEISKKLFRFAGVPTADWICVTCDDTAAREKILDSVGLPCVIKPLSCGSSVGVSIVDTEAELDKALELAHVYESKILAEKKIVGREFSVGYLGGTVLPPIEIIPKAGFYDYKNKYLPGMTEEICPADLTEDQVKRVSELCALAFETLDLGGYARIDFIMSEEDGDFYCLEANTLPGMTPSSLLPQEAAAVGISYGELCEKIVALARAKGNK
ncbi:MAG: D-alanine--D-alanine ligase [Ruminococcaceae bacterium]|nr:D-alanine--D-alanine ligase [Oscillospiraceae bacterium]